MFQFLVPIALLIQSLNVLHSPTQNPGRRVDPEMFFHAGLKKIVLLDGTPSYLGQPLTTEIHAWDGRNWELVPAGVGPTGRCSSSAVYDVDRDVIVSFGGRVGRSEKVVNETWEWNTKGWTQHTDPTMQVRDDQTMVYDEARKKTFLFGGSTFPRVPGPLASDIFEWDGTHWKLISSDGPQGRISPMAYDVVRHETILFGGAGAVLSGRLQYFGDTWSWNGTAWKKLTNKGPGSRAKHAIAFDKRISKIFLYGGERNTVDQLSDMWEWDGQKWSKIKLSEPNPGTRRNHSMAYDEGRNVMVLYGGIHENQTMNDTWEWDGIQWKKIQ